jgi:hypothetical protein
MDANLRLFIWFSLLLQLADRKRRYGRMRGNLGASVAPG